MKIALYFFGILLLISVNLLAQKKQNVYFLKDNGTELKTKEGADYIRIISEPDSGSVNYILTEFYLNGKKKTNASVSSINPLLYEGLMTSYTKDGKRISLINFQKGIKTGKAYYYHPNGKIQKEIEFNDPIPTKVLPIFGNIAQFRTLNYFDTSGVQIIKDGRGHVKQYDYATKLVEEGDLEEGYKIGEWRGEFLSKGYRFLENYKEGKLIAGITTDSAGNKYSYSQIESQPEFKGGLKEFYKFIGINFRYPAKARESGVSGRVVSKFVVDKDGSLTDIKIVKDLGYGTGEEAVTVLELSPKWTPGKQRGVPVRVLFTLPISLNLKAQEFNRKF